MLPNKSINDFGLKSFWVACSFAHLQFLFSMTVIILLSRVHAPMNAQLLVKTPVY